LVRRAREPPLVEDVAREGVCQEMQRTDCRGVGPVWGRSPGEEISWLACVWKSGVLGLCQRALFLMGKQGMLIVYPESSEQI